MIKYFVKKMGNQASVLAKLSKESFDEKETERLEKIKIEGIPEVDRKGRDKIMYMLPAQISLSEYLGQEVNSHRFYNFWVQFLEIVKAVEEEQLYVKNLVLDPELIFVDGNSGKIYFLYMPIENSGIQKSVCSFLKSTLSVLQGDEYEEIKKFFHRCPNSTIEEMTDFIKNTYPQIYLQAAINSDDKKADNTHRRILIRRLTQEARVIDKDVFRIGTAEQMDYRLDNHRISRDHLSVLKNGDSICVVENQASNGTYVNGVRLKKEDVIELHHGDIIQIADEEFQFRVQK